VSYTQLTQRGGQLMMPLLGAALVGCGLALLVQRVRTEGIGRVWPLLYLALGVAGVTLGSTDERDEAWWLLETGASLLAETLSTVAARLLGPMATLAVGLVALGGTLIGRFTSVAGESHVE
jgi:hypothetical protein